MEYEIKQRLSAQIGIGYAQKGIDIGYELFSASIDSENNTVKKSYQFNRDLRLDYISIPLVFQYTLDRKDRFYAVAGFYNSIAVQFLIKESLTATNTQTFGSSGSLIGSSESKNWTTDAYAGLFDAGLLAGIGINLPLTKKMVAGIDIRSAVGLINVPKKYEEYGFQSFSDTSKNISLETGIKLQYRLQ